MIQIVCPKCKHEFAYDNGKIDADIARLGIEIRDVMTQLAEHKLKSYQLQRQNTDWWLRAKRTLHCKQKELAELRAKRKLMDEHRHRQEHEALKLAIKEICGEEAFRKCIALMEEMVSAYRVSDMAKTEYSHAKGRGVTSIAKL